MQVYETRGMYLFLIGSGYFWFPAALLAEAVQTFILADFCYYYVKRWLNSITHDISMYSFGLYTSIDLMTTFSHLQFRARSTFDEDACLEHLIASNLRGLGRVITCPFGLPVYLISY
jgi:hypothetical protein